MTLCPFLLRAAQKIVNLCCFILAFVDIKKKLNEAINDDLKHLDLWMQGNKLSLNVSKTQSVLICTKPKHQTLRTAGDSLCLNVMGNDLDVVQKVKYQGVQVDNSLDWKEQIKVISSKLSKALGLLKHARNFLSESS